MRRTYVEEEGLSRDVLELLSSDLDALVTQVAETRLAEWDGSDGPGGGDEGDEDDGFVYPEDLLDL